jgi:hypothetical protein
VDKTWERCALTTNEFLAAVENGLSKRNIARWYERRTVAELAELRTWIHGYLIRLSHPRPVSQQQGLEFMRLVLVMKSQGTGFNSRLNETVQILQGRQVA